MGSIGTLLVILGFGSLILEQFNMEFRLLAWANDYQPWFGIVLGVIGVVLILVHFASRNKDGGGSPPAQTGPQQ